MTANSVDALINQIKVLMLDAARFAVRAKHVHQMNRGQILAPWAMGVQPYPPFIQVNPRLLTKIREVRLEAARKIQTAAETEFDRQASKLQREGETLITTIESMMKGKNTPSLEEGLSHMASFIGNSKANLQSKMEERRLFHAKRQPTTKDWDDFFHYSIAYRHNQDAKTSAFEVTAADRAQADRDTDKELRSAIAEDSEDETPYPPQQKCKRGEDPHNQCK